MTETRHRGIHVLAARNQDRVPEPMPLPPRHWVIRFALPGAIVAGLLLLVVVSAYETLTPAVGVRVSPVIVKQARVEQAGEVTVQAAGWVEADPYVTYVSARTDGVVRELLVLEGETVATGQVVAELYDDDARIALRQAEAELWEREAALQTALADLAAASAEWEQPIERERAVQVAKARYAEAVAALAQGDAEIAAEQAALSDARSLYERTLQLYSRKLTAEAEMIRVRSAYEAQTAKLNAALARRTFLDATYQAAQAELAAASAHHRLRTQERRSLAVATAAVESARARLARAQADLEEAQLRLERTRIRAPRGGVVLRRLAEPGAKLVLQADNPQSAHVVALYDPQRLQVRVDVPLADAAKVGVGQPAQVVAEILPDLVFAGTVSRVLHEADIQKNTLGVKVALANPDPRLRPEMLVRTRFLAVADTENRESTEEVVYAPAAALRQENGSTQGWIVRAFDGERGTVEKQTLELAGARDGDWVAVRSGLRPGDLVVVAADRPLREGRRVQITSFAEN